MLMNRSVCRYLQIFNVLDHSWVEPGTITMVLKTFKTFPTLRTLLTLKTFGLFSSLKPSKRHNSRTKTYSTKHIARLCLNQFTVYEIHKTDNSFEFMNNQVAHSLNVTKWLNKIKRRIEK